MKIKKRASKRDSYLLLIVFLGLISLFVYTQHPIFLLGMIAEVALAFAIRPYRPSKGKPLMGPQLGGGPHTIWGNSGQAVAEYHLNFARMEENEQRKKKGLPPDFGV